MSGLKKWLKIEVDFNLGDIVYQRVASDPIKGMVTVIRLCPGGIAYGVSWDGGMESVNFPIELTTEFVKEFDADA